jgi:3D (Asp-Asp-Asp) domain-containing protein
MIFSKFLTMKRFFAFLFLTSTSFAGMAFSRTIIVSNDSFDKSSTLSVVPISYDVETRYSDDLLYGEEKVVQEGIDGYALESGTVVVEPTNKIIEVGRGPISISYGSTTGYGANCVGCSGNVACSTRNGTHNLIRDGIYYNDSKYGNVRIIAADNSLYSCGTIIEIDNGIMDPFMAIVLDTGGAMRSAWSNGNILIDIAFPSEYSNGVNDATNKSGNVKFKVYRNGW